MAQSTTPTMADLYNLYSSKKYVVLEELFKVFPQGLLASMLSAYHLRSGNIAQAARMITHIQENGENINERALKAKTLTILPQLNAPLVEEPRVHLLILTCNRAAYAENALRQLAATDYTNYAVYILDNNSTDGTWEIAQRARHIFPPSVPVEVRRMAFNTGRPMGHNILLAEYDHSAAEFIAIGDDDLVEVPAQWLRDMVCTARCFPKAAVIGGKALSPGLLKSIHGGVRHLTLFDDDELETSNRAECADFGQFDYVDKVDHVIGCLHLYRAAPLFSDIGLFDIRYSPCQCVDLDHHFHTRLLGHEIIYNGLVEFTHARAMGNAAENDRALKGNALGNLAKLIYKFDAKCMNELIKDTQRLRQEWLSE